jgi:hypothetical protein
MPVDHPTNFTMASQTPRKGNPQNVVHTDRTSPRSSSIKTVKKIHWMQMLMYCHAV